MVQWANDPTWRELERSHKEALIQADLSFLRQQLSQEHIELLLLTGSGIAKAYSDRLKHDLAEIASSDRVDLKLFIGRTPCGLTVIGWNKNLQSSFGISNDYISAVSVAIEKTRSAL